MRYAAKVSCLLPCGLESSYLTVFWFVYFTLDTVYKLNYIYVYRIKPRLGCLLYESLKWILILCSIINKRLNWIWRSDPACFFLCCWKTSTIFGQTLDKILDILILFFSSKNQIFHFFNRVRVWVSSQSGTRNKTRPDKTVQII